HRPQRPPLHPARGSGVHDAGDRRVAAHRRRPRALGRVLPRRARPRAARAGALRHRQRAAGARRRRARPRRTRAAAPHGPDRLPRRRRQRHLCGDDRPRPRLRQPAPVLHGHRGHGPLHRSVGPPLLPLRAVGGVPDVGERPDRPAHPAQVQGGVMLENTRLTYLFLYVRDLAAARAFYSDTLGLRVIEEDADAVKYDAGRAILALNRADDYAIDLPDRRDNSTDIVFLVDDLDAVRAGLEARGVSFLPTDHYQVGAIADFYDPDGH